MRKKLILIALIITNFLYAQEVSVKDHLWGASIGLIDCKLEYETKLTRLSTLRIASSIDQWQYNYDFYTTNEKVTKKGTHLSPSLSIEPTFYHGLDRRARLNRNTNNNSSNYLSLKAMFVFGKQNIYNFEPRIAIANTFLIVPKYGIRRNFTKNFFYEFAFGIGLQHSLATNKSTKAFYDLQTRIGYNF